jgi:hypothetical protein
MSSLVLQEFPVFLASALLAGVAAGRGIVELSSDYPG